jgi:hypothetical protein
MFLIIEVSKGAPNRQEQLGTKPKFWYDDDDLGLCLFKETRFNTGEDWAEKIAAYLCEVLGIPHAQYELAMWQGKRGVITRALHQETERLFLGNELLASNLPGYGEETSRRGINRQHTLENVLNCLSVYPPPRDTVMPIGVSNAAEALLGYLMLDALIGNTDRHHENWGCIAASNGSDVRLAPTYDHASSLGRELTDQRRETMLTTRDKYQTVAAYCTSRRSRSALYLTEQDKFSMSMSEAFFLGGKRFPEAAHGWLERLATLTIDKIHEGFSKIPAERISGPSVEFGVQVILYNQRRLMGS